MSWKPDVFVEGKWSSNQLRFATEAEAESNAQNLMDRWMLVEDYRASPSDDPVNYVWDPKTGLTKVEVAE